MKELTPEQLLIIADHFCETYNVRLKSFSDLAAAAAVPGARFEGIPLYTSPDVAGTALADYICMLKPLSALNVEFSELACDVYRRWASGPAVHPGRAY